LALEGGVPLDREIQCVEARKALQAHGIDGVNVTVSANYDGFPTYIIWLPTGHHTAGPMRLTAKAIAGRFRVPLDVTYRFGATNELSFFARVLPHRRDGELRPREVQLAGQALLRASELFERAIHGQSYAEIRTVRIGPLQISW
jgi:hypothetical protein